MYEGENVSYIVVKCLKLAKAMVDRPLRGPYADPFLTQGLRPHKHLMHL
jgi:hypothetical protein